MNKRIKYLAVMGIWILSVIQVSALESWFNPLGGPTRILSPFGHQRAGYAHKGIDVEATMYTPVYAIADGVVIKAAPDSKGVDQGGGHMIFIDHGNGIQSWYMHLSAYGVQEGQRVQAGDLIALSGDSGNVTGPHLHLEYRVEGIPVDPSFLFTYEGQDVQAEQSEENFEDYFRVQQQ